MLANCIYIRCVNPCLPVFIHVRISIKKHVDSHLYETRPLAWKICTYPNIHEQDQMAKSRASIKQADGKKITAPLLMVFLLIATLKLKQWAVFITFVFIKKFDRPSVKMIFNVVARKESLMN